MVKKSSWKLYIFIVFLILFVPVWRGVLSDWFKEIPDDFVYEADLTSIDNFYDEEESRFTGEQISNSEFVYEAIDVRGDTLLIDNKFEVYTLDDEKIISINRVLGVDSQTGLYNPDFGDKERTGSLFAPIGTKGGESFVYWHVNYDEPFVMKYVSEEVIDGLKVFKYETLGNSYEIDQTDSLTHLEGVPDIRGVKVYPSLRLWIEPTTGMMVKFEDSAEGYFYDLESGENLNPWNNYSNVFTESAIIKKVGDIEFMKWKFWIIDYVMPFLLWSLALSLIIVHIKTIIFEEIDEERSQLLRSRFMMFGFVFVSLVMLYGIYTQYLRFSADDQDGFKVGIITLNETSTFSLNVDAFISGLAENGYVVGENLELERVDAQRDDRVFVDTIREFKKENFDLIYTLTTTATKLAAQEVSDIPIVFSIVTYPVRQGIIDSFEDSGNNLVGVKHNIPIASQWFEFESILKDNPEVSFDRLIYVSGVGFETTELQFSEFTDFFDEEGVNYQRLVAKNVEDLNQQLNNLEGDYILYAGCDAFNQTSGGEALIDFSLANEKILISCISSMVPKGALFSRSVDFVEIGEIASDKASLILQGANPRWLESVSPRIPLVNINAEAADVLNLDINYDNYPNLLILPE